MKESQNGICIIVGARPCDLSGLSVTKEDFVIGADKGAHTLLEYHLPVSLAIGDWDSADMPEGVPCKTYPAEKDDTDVLLAVREGLARGFKSFHIYGALGGRTDHLIANLQVLLFLQKEGAEGYLYGEKEEITLLSNAAKIWEKPKGILSVFAVGEAKGVTLSGVKYPLSDAVLSDAYPIGVSNEFTGEKATVSVKDGTLFLICEKE